MIVTEEIFDGHPFLAQVSANPVMLQGYLVVLKDTWVRVKIQVPNYPSIRDISVEFGEQIALTRDTDFVDKLVTLQENAPSLLTFLHKLQTLLASIIQEKVTSKIISVNSLKTFLDDLKAALTIPDVTLSANKELNMIELNYNDICMMLKQNFTAMKKWTIVSSDLPQIKDWSIRECDTLSEAAKNLKTGADRLTQTWRNLQDIDRNCWVIEPLNPKPFHLHRRIYLNPALSILVTLDPKNNNHPDIAFYGSDSEIAKAEATVTDTMCQWSEEKLPTENLLTILQLDELPKRSDKNDSSQDNHRGLVNDTECSICFCVEAENEEYPSKVCNNTKCQLNFHAYCLSRWLQSGVNNTVVFDQIHGSCPHCRERISCPVSIS